MEIIELKRIITEQKQYLLHPANLIKRDIFIPNNILKSNEIIVVTGVRRCGKSSLMKILFQELSLPIENSFYINFDDERLVEFIYKDFNKIIDICYELSGSSKNKIYLFLDEIQNVRYFEKWLNRLYENKQFKIFITGSNATLLSGEISTALTGRNYVVDLFPFSFKEYLALQKEPVIDKDIFTTKEAAKYRKHLGNYLELSSFPEVININESELLSQYYKDIIYRDIITRYKIKNTREFREFSKYLFSNITSHISYNQLSKVFSGIRSPNTIKNYLHWLQNAFLFFTLYQFNPSFKKQLKSLPKIYTIDHGLIKKIGFSISENTGIIYENTVFLELLRRQKECFYYMLKSGREIDFVIWENRKITQLIQVSYNLQDKRTVDREERALIEGMELFKVKKSYIINYSMEKVRKTGRNTIIYVPLWKWLLK